MTNSTDVLSVSQLNRHVRSLLEFEMGAVFVEGEISNLSKPSSGHYYFTLKDDYAQIRCVYFRSRHATSFNALENGQQVIAGGKLSLYEARGDFQLIIEQLREAGQGNLFRQFELLKNKLSALGLFESTRKKIIPPFAHTIGIITSPTGAAIKDALTTLSRRYPLAEVIIYPSEVQGKLAHIQLIKAIEQANNDKRCDVIILARGGGSLEDLWAFNDEQLAYAIAKSVIPVVSGVGHETDFTIADFVADLRAATPTAAAEAVTPNKLDLMITIQAIQANLTTAMFRVLQHKRLTLKHATQTITSPGRIIQTHWQTLDYLISHLRQCMRQALSVIHHRLTLLNTRTLAQNPARRLSDSQMQLKHLNNRLDQTMQALLKQKRQTLASFAATLQAVSPLATLDRGYAIVTHQDAVVHDSQQVSVGQVINVRLAKGNLSGKVIKKGE